MLEKYAFYHELVKEFGEEKAKRFVTTYFTEIVASKLVSREILETAEPDIRDYIGQSIFGPCLKPFVSDTSGEKTRINLIYTVIMPSEHVRRRKDTAAD